jgi:phosphatidylglycerophosphate synthase
MAKLIDKSILTIPNLLSFYRILSFPVIFYFAWTNRESIYFILLIISLITDMLDGYIARRFNMQTEFGARLDSFADIGMYVVAIVGVICFKSTDIAPYAVSLTLFVSLLILPEMISFIKFRTFSSLHLYSAKMAGCFMGAFFFTLFIFGFYPVLYYFMLATGILSFLEEIVVLLLIPEMKSDVKGLYWLRKSRKVMLANQHKLKESS